MNKQELNNEVIQEQKLCEGCLGGYHCIECFYFNTNRRDGSYARCEKNNSWHRPDDYYCSSFKHK